MKQSIFILLLLQLFPFVVSCGTERETRDLIRLLRSFQETTIDLPDTLMFIKGQNRGFCQIDYSLPVMLYYYGPDECSNCAINQLADKMPMSKIADSLKTFHVIILFSPKPEDVPQVVQRVLEKQFDFPVYVDFDEKHPVMVGNPLSSRTLMSIFTKTLSSLNNKQH